MDNEKYKTLAGEWLQADHTQYLLTWMLTAGFWISEFKRWAKERRVKIKMADKEIMNLLADNSPIRWYKRIGCRGDIVPVHNKYIMGVTDAARDASYRHMVLEPIDEEES